MSNNEKHVKETNEFSPTLIITSNNKKVYLSGDAVLDVLAILCQRECDAGRIIRNGRRYRLSVINDDKTGAIVHLTIEVPPFIFAKLTVGTVSIFMQVHFLLNAQSLVIRRKACQSCYFLFAHALYPFTVLYLGVIIVTPKSSVFNTTEHSM